MARIPCGDPFIFGVDDQHHAAHLRRGQQAASARREQELSAEAASLQPAIHGQARQAEAWHVIARQTAPCDLRRTDVVHRGGAQAAESENGVEFMPDGEEVV